MMSARSVSHTLCSSLQRSACGDAPKPQAASARLHAPTGHSSVQLSARGLRRLRRGSALRVAMPDDSAFSFTAAHETVEQVAAWDVLGLGQAMVRSQTATSGFRRD